MDKLEEIKRRVEELTGRPFAERPIIITDTSDFMRIQPGHIVRIADRDFFIEGNKYEGRFGIGDQPKYWVFAATDLVSGEKKVLKTVFHENFQVRIGLLKIRCNRSPEKEARVLELVKGDCRFMQGYTALDSQGNHVRIINLIKGPSIFSYIYDIDKTHEEYFHEDLSSILWNLSDCIEAIRFLHENATCHGDIRNDHIIIDLETGIYRWIDFDLDQNVLDFDVWGIGNIINYATGKGIKTFHSILKNNEFSDKIKLSLNAEDASAFYEYRLINMGKLYPYIPKRLNDILMCFSVSRRRTYESMGQVLDDFREMLEVHFPRAKNHDRSDKIIRGEME